ALNFEPLTIILDAAPVVSLSSFLKGSSAAMRRKTRTRILPPLALLLALAPVASAQTPTDARGALASFPDSQAVLYVNARRIVNELLPRVMPAADYQKIIASAQKGGFDPRDLDYAAVAIRFADPAPATGLPD